MRNHVAFLLDEQGVEQYKEEEKGDIAVKYFDNLFCSAQPSYPSELLEGFEIRVTSQMNRELRTPVTDAEIKKAIKAIKSDNPPRPDGMTGKFFLQFWQINGPQITKEVKAFFESDCLPSDWNFTQICLLPQKTNPNRMTDLRPISLCSVVYKIVSEVLRSRLKKILPHLVSPTQRAFVVGRLISDNLFLITFLLLMS